jgi:hypothetical protein
MRSEKQTMMPIRFGPWIETVISTVTEVHDHSCPVILAWSSGLISCKEYNQGISQPEMLCLYLNHFRDLLFRSQWSDPLSSGHCSQSV